MTATRPPISTFRSRLRARDHLLGLFIKFPSSHSTEVVGSIGFDFIVVDQEHSPFDLATIDMVILGARAFNIAPLVRIAHFTPAAILSVLDMGATGVLVPHVDSPEKAREVAAACRYRGGTRGFAHTNRAGSFAEVTMNQHKDQQDSEATCIAMIEDPEAVDCIDEIVAVDGIDAVFVGRGDLCSAYEADSTQAPVVRKATERIFEAANKVGMPVVILPSTPDDFRSMRDLGSAAFICGSDQGLLKNAAKQALATYGRTAVTS